MGYRTVVITKNCKLSYKNGYILVRSEETTMLYLDEIDTILIDSTMVSITSYLLCELMNKKIKVIFCDEEHNPKAECVPYYGGHNTSKKIQLQAKWDDAMKEEIWAKIVSQKINNQFSLLNKIGIEDEKLCQYVEKILPGDSSNREGHAAKVYFNYLFGKDFCRHDTCNINIALNYGYSILLSSVNKEVVNLGHITQLGIHHCNEFNPFNLSCDLMEPFRVLVDEVVYENKGAKLDKNYKMQLVDLLNTQYVFNDKKYYLSNIISIYIKGALDAMNENNSEYLYNFSFS